MKFNIVKWKEVIVVKRIVAFFKSKFSKNKKITLFAENTKGILAECGGNYCSDLC